MRSIHAFLCSLVPALALSALPSVHAQTTSTTYQGELRDRGGLATGIYDLRFRLYNAAVGGSALTSSVCADDVPIVDGRFTVILPFTVPANGIDSFLEIDVRTDVGTACSTGSYTTLSPRQAMTPAPVSVYAMAVREEAPNMTGALRFNPTTKQLQVFDGTFWMVVHTSADTDVAPFDNTQTFTPGTHSFVVPANVTSLTIAASGGGGGGGAIGPGSTTLPTECQSGFGTYAAGGGGGGSSACGAFRIPVTPGETLSLTVGAGGTGTAAPANNGQASRIRRGASDIIIVPGGFGGGRRGTVVTMGSGASLCLGVAGGAGATQSTQVSLLAPGVILGQYLGNPSFGGVGPSCTDDSPDIFCPTLGGNGANSSTINPFFTPGMPNVTNGAGGDGGGAAAPHEPGQNGYITLYWY